MLFNDNSAVSHLKAISIGCALCAAMLGSFPASAHPGDDHKLAYLNAQIEQQPEQQKTLIARAATYVRTGQFDLAMADFNRAKQLGDPIHIAYQLGILYLKTGEYLLAIEQFDNYLALFPGHSLSLENRAKAFRAKGEINKAIADYRTFLHIAPYTNPGHYLTVAELILSDNDHSHAINEALAIIDGGISELGIVPQLQSYAIKLELRRGYPELAIKRQRTLANISRHSPQWYLDMAQLLAVAGHNDEAINHLDIGQLKLEQRKLTPAKSRLQKSFLDLEKRLRPS